jgi:acylphosphatase
MRRVHALYSGNVHGVGFRFTAIDAARKSGVCGWVKNTSDGKVELVAEGNEEDLNKFISEVNAVMASFIRDKKISWEPGTGEFVNFQISY